MNQLNSLIIEGNAKNAKLSEPKKGFKVLKLDLEVSRYYKNRNGEGIEEISVFNVEAYGLLAENAEKYLSQGKTALRVVGRIKAEHWKDKDGKSFSRVLVVAEHIEFKARPEAKEEQTA